MKTVTFIGDVSDQFNGRACVYQVDPPLDGYEYVCVSAVSMAQYNVTETFIFGWSPFKGTVDKWGELNGSMRNTTKHADALKLAGYDLPINMGDTDD